ncbi:MAG: PqqD family protein [Pyrinomonadaceae bacterium]|nr:PqqD family protein [Pyrinomonadaceae bacterium]
MKNSIQPKAREKDIVVQNTPEELLVFDMKTNKAHCLNETVAEVWGRCDGTTSVSEIANSFEGANEDLVWLAIDELEKHDLLEAGEGLSLSGSSRRELVKKIGFASMIALPVVASLAAPSNALAAASCACAAPGDCTTQPTCPSTTNCNGSGVCAP